MDDHFIMFSRNVTKSKTEITSIEDMLNSYPLLKGINLEKGHDFEDSTRNGR